ncbi:MAG: alpha/beta hydrolase [Deltaproteobacteria bacterium]|nr:alpha/beta hydrolase [Deltaproteobacteria bacterium]
MDTHFDVKDLRAYDGTKIVYQDTGGDDPIVLANGLGGAFEAWSYLVKHFAERHRILSWDYRGLFQSGRPDFSRLTIPDHVDDLTRILDRENVDRAVFFGWSMGTQVILEHALRRPDRVRALVLLCGAAGRPFDTALHTSTSRYTMPVLFNAMKALKKPYGAFLKFATRLPYSLELLTATGLFWRAGSDVIRGMVDEYVQLEWDTYGQIMLELGRHDARPYLREIRVPVFIIAATRDFFTPVKTAEHMAHVLPDAELKILNGATHYAPLEAPDEINAMVDDFLARKVLNA